MSAGCDITTALRLRSDELSEQAAAYIESLRALSHFKEIKRALDGTTCDCILPECCALCGMFIDIPGSIKALREQLQSMTERVERAEAQVEAAQLSAVNLADRVDAVREQLTASESARQRAEESLATSERFRLEDGIGRCQLQNENASLRAAKERAEEQLETLAGARTY